MPTLSNLPQELLSLVVECAAGSDHDAKTLSNICRLNRRFNSSAMPVLYSKWIYLGDEHGLASLLRFLRTIISNTSLASLVHSLDVQYWGSTKPRRSRIKLDMPSEYLNILLEAFRLAEITMSEEYLMSALFRHDRTPFMALLLTRLPNVSVMLAQVPAPCEAFLKTVLERAVEDRNEETFIQAFPNLKELCLSSEWKKPDLMGANRQAPEALYQLYLQRLGPVFRLKQLERLSLFDVNVHNLLCNWKAGVSPVKHLTLVNSSCATATRNKTHAILAMPKSLVSLSFYQNVHPISPPGQLLPISNAALYEAVRQQKESLEYLDIYNDDLGGASNSHTDDTKFGSLREFKSLRTLCIQPQTLLGDGADGPVVSFRLMDALPLSLEKLTLYTEMEPEPDTAINLEEQIRGIFFGRNCPQLRTIIVEALSSISNDSNISCPPTYPGLEKTCQEANVRFFELPGESLLKGGSQEPYFRTVNDQRRRRETLREARRLPLGN